MAFANEVVSNEVERLWKKAVMSLFDVESRLLSEGTGEKYGQLQAGLPTPQPPRQGETHGPPLCQTLGIFLSILLTY